jgi:LysR family glycine cleavage system transcriptional activator
MMRRLPPLNALRAFEAVARHLSIAKAADELSVTPAAVSHQIKTLEDHLGVRLLQRDGRTTMLTEAGQACLPGIRHGFESLAAAIQELDRLGASGILNVSVAPSFAAKWLVPRLDRFTERFPDIDVRVSASMQLADFESDGVDLAIRYGAGRYPGLAVGLLMREEVMPVCAPALLDGTPPLDTPAALAAVTLLHDDSPEQDLSCPTWPMWLKAAGVTGVDGKRGPRFNQSSLVIEAAVAGKGVALAKATLAAADLKAGRLVKPFEGTLPVEFAYYIVCPKARLESRKVSAFRDWLLEEAKSGA